MLAIMSEIFGARYATYEVGDFRKSKVLRLKVGLISSCSEVAGKF